MRNISLLPARILGLGAVAVAGSAIAAGGLVNPAANPPSPATSSWISGMALGPARPNVPASHGQARGDASAGNGITVGPPKLFDDRALFELLQANQVALRGLGSFYNAAPIASAVGQFQGSTVNQAFTQTGAQATIPWPMLSPAQLAILGVMGNSAAATLAQSEMSASASSTATSTGGAAMSTTGTATSGTTGTGTSTSGTTSTATGSTSTGGSSTITTTTTTTTGSGAATPTPPATTTAPTGPQLLPTGLNPVANVQMGASDILDEQTELNYQITNLSLLLNRSVSDRVIRANDGKPSPRLQAVLGFDIGVDPRQKDAVAEVEITVTTMSPWEPSDPDLAPSVVQLLPESKTYNTAALTSTQKGFSVGAQFSLLNLWLSNTTLQSNLFVAKDVDTVAFDRGTNATDRSVTFGWQFRPVLNHPTVSPGTRQVFAVLSLPVSAMSPKGETPVPNFLGKVAVKTCWKHYKRFEGVVDREIGVSAPAKDVPVPLAVYSSGYSDAALQPKIENLSVADAGNGNVLFAVAGYNFFPGTAVTLGDINQLASSTVDGERRLRFVAPAIQLAYRGAAIVGPYGASVPAVRGGWEGSQVIVDGTSRVDSLSPTISRVTLDCHMQASPSGQSSSHREPIMMNLEGDQVGECGRALRFAADRQLEFQVAPKRLSVGIANSAWPSLPVIVAIGNQAFGLSDQPFTVKEIDACKHEEEITFDVATSLIRTARKFVVQPLGYPVNVGGSYVPALDEDFVVSTVTAQSAEASRVYVTVLGQYLNASTVLGQHAANSIKVIANGVVADDHYPHLVAATPTVFRFWMTPDEARGLKNVIVVRDGAAPQVWPVGAPTPGLVTLNPGPVNVGDDIFVPITGDSLDRVAAAKFDGAPLGWSYDPSTKTAKVHVTSNITAKAGNKTLVFTLDDATEKTLVLKVVDPTTAVAAAGAPAATGASTEPGKIIVQLTKVKKAISDDDVDVDVYGQNLDQVVSAKHFVDQGNSDDGRDMWYWHSTDGTHGLLRVPGKMIRDVGKFTLIFTYKNKGTALFALDIVPR